MVTIYKIAFTEWLIKISGVMMDMVSRQIVKQSMQHMLATITGRDMHEASWDVEHTRNRLPFLTKQWCKHNVLTMNCHVIDKDIDINPELHRTKKKI